jgi:Ca2+-binding EF-hand superfamily protein
LDSFRAVDRLGLSFVDRNALFAFLRRHRHVTEADVDAVFRRLDGDGDDRLSFQEFAEVLAPRRGALRGYRATSPEASRTYTETFRRSSPLRNSSPLRESQSSAALRKSAYNTSPLRNSTLMNSTFSSSMRAATGFSPRKSSPLRSSNRVGVESPYRTSPLRSSRLDQSGSLGRESSYRPSSPLKPASYSSRAFEPSQRLGQSTFGTSNGFEASARRSSPLRKASPLRSGSPQRSFATGAFSASRTRNDPSVEENELVAWFQDEIRIAREIERKKNELALKHDFNLVDAFRLFDKHDFGYATVADFEDSFRYLGFVAPAEELYLMIKHFSHLQSTRLGFADFTEVLVPKQEEYARILRNRAAAKVSEAERMRVFTRDTMELLLETFRLVLNAEAVAERVRQRLSRMPEFSMHQAFMAVDKDRNGFITIDEFQSILQSHGIFATSKDLQSLLAKYDKNKDGRVSYSEFVEEVTPKSPRRLISY